MAGDLPECTAIRSFFVHYPPSFALPAPAATRPPPTPHLPYRTQDNSKGQQNRLSRFVYKAGNNVATRESEQVLMQTAEKDTNIHSAGWVGFKPSTYGKGVRNLAQTVAGCTGWAVVFEARGEDGCGSRMGCRDGIAPF